MLTTSHWQKSYKRYLHTCERSKSEPGAVAYIQTWAIASHADEYEGVQGKQVGDEYIASPCRDHVSVEERRQRSPHGRAFLDRFDP